MSSLSTRIRGLADRVQDALADMSPRDRTLLVGLVVGAILLVAGSGAWWLSSTLDDMKSRLSDREATLANVQTLAVEQARAASRADAIEERLQEYASTDLSSFLEQAARNAKVQDKLDAVREKSSATDGNIEEKLYTVALNGLQLQELSDFLWEVETAGYPLQIRTFRVKRRRRKGENRLNVDLDISAFRVLEDERSSEEG